MKNSILIVLFISLISCGQKKLNNPLELTFLNKNLKSLIIKDSVRGLIDISMDEYNEKFANPIQFKIENKSSERYLLVIDNAAKLFFPYDLESLAPENILFFDEEGNSPKYSGTTASGEMLFYDYLNFKDSIDKKFYRGIGYSDKDRSWWSINDELKQSMIKIGPKEILYFETYIHLPYSMNRLTGNWYNGVIFDTTKQYHSKLKYRFKAWEDFEEFLTELQKKEITENNYIIFSKELISTNEIPVKFLD